MQDTGIQALTIHGRTRAQLYKGEADWTLIREVKNNPRIRIPIFGNGDIDSPEKAVTMKNEYGVDGVMIGRASIGNPWIFRQIKHYIEFNEIMAAPDLEERIRICTSHLMKSIEWKGDRLGIFEMRRHYAGYFKGIENSKEWRSALVRFDTLAEILDYLNEMPYKKGEEIMID